MQTRPEVTTGGQSGGLVDSQVFRDSDTFGTLFLNAAEDRPDATFLYTVDRELTYRDAVVRVATIARQLTNAGMQPRDVLGCYTEAQIPTLFVDLACTLVGIVPFPLSPVFSASYFAGIVERTQASAVFTVRKHAESLCGVGFTPFVYLEAGEELDRSSPSVALDVHSDLELTKAVEFLRSSSRGITDRDIFMIQPTSGSTGKPKLVYRTHRAFLRYAEYVGAQLDLDAERPNSFLLATALTHAFGLHMVTTAFAKKAPLCVPTHLDTGARLAEVRKLDPTVIPILPRIQESLLRQRREEDDPKRSFFGPSARYVCSAGGPGHRPTLAALHEEGLHVIEFYGSTEASVVAVTPRGGWRPGYAGKVVDDAEIRFGKDGEVEVRSPGVAMGYVGDPARTGEFFIPDGFYKTGDIAELDDDGYLRIVGRKRDVFNTSEGSNIYPRRIENSLEEMDVVHQAVLLGDARPYLSALIAVEPRHAPTGSDNDSRDLPADAYIPPETAPDLYEDMTARIARLNRQLERVEQIVRVALFARPFPESTYRLVGPGKVKRDRKTIEDVFAAHAKRLYDSQAESDPRTFVPGADRRLRSRE